MTDDERQPPITLGAVSVVRAFRPGDVVFIETSEHYPFAVVETIRKQLELVSERFGVKVILLHPGLKVAAATETRDPSVQS